VGVAIEDQFMMIIRVLGRKGVNGIAINRRLCKTQKESLTLQ
jgi:hypothetical protein